MGIGVFRIGYWVFKSPIPNPKHANLQIKITNWQFYHHLVNFTFSSLFPISRQKLTKLGTPHLCLLLVHVPARLVRTIWHHLPSRQTGPATHLRMYTTNQPKSRLPWHPLRNQFPLLLQTQTQATGRQGKTATAINNQTLFGSKFMRCTAAHMLSPYANGVQ